MLTELVRYAHSRGLLIEPGFAPKIARWAIAIAGDGRVLGLLPIGDQERKPNPGMDFPVCPDLEYSELMGKVQVADDAMAQVYGQPGGRAQFLLDTAQVVALYGGVKDGQPVEAVEEGTTAKHEHFVALLRAAAAVIPQLDRAADCLEDAKVLALVRAQLAESRAKANEKMTLQIAGSFPLHSKDWHDWWRGFRVELRCRQTKKSNASKMRCYLHGKEEEPAPTHPKLAGLADVGAVPFGCALISFDEESFRSGGLEQSANYAVCERGATAYVAAFNQLVQHNAETLAGARVIFWFDQDVAPEDHMLRALLGGSVFAEEGKDIDAHQRARELLTAIRTGKRPDLADNRYFAMTVSGNRGRAVVRDWMEGSFEELVANVDAWFDDLSIVRADGSGLAPTPKFLGVLGSTVRDLKELPAPFVTRMWAVAVRQEAIPQAALAGAVRRARMAVVQDDPVRSAGIGLIKAYHIRKARKGGDRMSEDIKPYLNPDHPNPAYHCGRLMAVYAALQRSALGDVGAGVVQRYYAAAIATPALVLGRLARLSQAHLGKLEGPGLTWWYESLLADVWGRLRDAVPRTLDLEEQSLFALGYYQQLADLRTKKADQPEPGTGDADTQTDGSVSNNE